MCKTKYHLNKHKKSFFSFLYTSLNSNLKLILFIILEPSFLFFFIFSSMTINLSIIVCISYVVVCEKRKKNFSGHSIAWVEFEWKWKKNHQNPPSTIVNILVLYSFHSNVLTTFSKREKKVVLGIAKKQNEWYSFYGCFVMCVLLSFTRVKRSLLMNFSASQRYV